MKTMSIMEAVKQFSAMSVKFVGEQQIAMEKAAQIVETRSKAIIGHYQTDTGPFDQWKPLADSTRREKQRLGYAPPDNPLLRTGDMRDSITHEASPRLAVVGSDDDVAVYQELGTSGPGAGIPPRSFLGAAAFQKEDEVAEIVVDAALSVMLGRKAISSL